MLIVLCQEPFSVNVHSDFCAMETKIEKVNLGMGRINDGSYFIP